MASRVEVCTTTRWLRRDRSVRPCRHRRGAGVAGVPAGPPLYARLWTKSAGVWRFRDSTFTASLRDPQFVFPTDGSVAVDATQLFRWTPPHNSDAQELRVGTSAGANDLFDSGEIVTTSTSVSGLPTTGPLYARILSRVNGEWRHKDIGFTLAAASPISSIVVPRDGQTSFDTVQPFEWSPVPLARGYHLTIGYYAWRERSAR